MTSREQTTFHNECTRPARTYGDFEDPNTQQGRLDQNDDARHHQVHDKEEAGEHVAPFVDGGDEGDNGAGHQPSQDQACYRLLQEADNVLRLVVRQVRVCLDHVW